MVLLRLFLTLLLATATVTAEQDNDSTAYCTSDSEPLLQQTPNTFFKVCPEQHKFRQFGAPICGDGSTFSFYVTKPPQKHHFTSRLLIEFVGGGACWDAQTCQKQAEYLTAPTEVFDSVLGLSCSEVAVGMEGDDLNMLCATKLGETDLTAYTTIVVPYCTQDCHSGDNTMTYDDGSVVNHAGANNLMSVMRYVFKNFDRPSHIILTGCSAGGTAVPLAYHLLHRQYSNFGSRSTQISVIADSPVFLTPSYFLENAFENWNTGNFVGKNIGFNYKKWHNNEEYPVKLWEYILHKGANKDKWGFVSHLDDPVSQEYFEWMSGSYGEDNADVNDQRNLEDNNNNNDNNIASQWYSELTTSIDSVKSKHSNVDSFWYDGEGHCSFGLYYPLQQDGFVEWAASIVAEQRLIEGHRFTSFLFSILAGSLLAVGSIFSSRQQKAATTDGHFVKYEDNDSPKSSSWKWSFRPGLFSFLGYFSDCPITSGYTLALTLNFWIMIIRDGFVHPINNPSLGPSAIVLSKYGINNPSLVVYRGELIRLFMSCFLCSGVLTYLFALITLWFYTRILEKALGWRNFMITCALIGVGSNIIYALIANGASCSSTALLIGLNAFAIVTRARLEQGTCMISTNTFFLFIIASFIFTFNSWIMLLVALILGFGFATMLYDNPATTIETPNKSNFHIKHTRLVSVWIVYAFLAFILVIRLRRPNKLYLEPYYTGCDLKYVTDIDNIKSKFYGDNDNGEGDDAGRRRRLEDNGELDNYCAQFCVPHVVSVGVSFGAQKLFDFEITKGTCDSIGYENHVADKTYKYFSYSLDVEIYQNDYNDDEN